MRIHEWNIDELFVAPGKRRPVWPEPLDSIVGTNGDDTLAGTAGKDTIEGLGGDDLLEGLGGKDRLDGGAKRDTMVGGAGGDILIGGKSADVFRYGSVSESRPDNSDFITLYKGRDSIDLMAIDANTLVGGNQDFVNVVALTGEAGQLAYSSNGSGGTIIEGDVDGDGIADLRIEIADDRRDTLTGGEGDDTLIGYAEDETILGNRGDDLLLGAGGHDLLVGGNDDDTIDGDAGDDTILGGEGVDLISGGSGGDLIWGYLSEGFEGRAVPADSLFGEAGDDIINAVANSTVFGGLGDDVITAAESPITLPGFLSGDEGNDTISVKGSVFGSCAYTITGGLGADDLSGGDANDTIEGGAGKDSIMGGDRDDVLIGGANGDVLDGGKRADTFLYIDVSDSNPSDPDLILKLASVDTLDLSAVDANALLGGDQAFARVTNFTGTAGELRLRLDGAGDTFIEGDVDGDGIADLAIRVLGDATDFMAFIL